MDVFQSRDVAAWTDALSIFPGNRILIVINKVIGKSIDIDLRKSIEIFDDFIDHLFLIFLEEFIDYFWVFLLNFSIDFCGDFSVPTAAILAQD